MSTKKDYKSNFPDVIKRLLEVSGKKKEYELAEILGFKKDSFAARKSRGSVPEKEIKIACASNGWNFDWVMHGTGEMKPDFHYKTLGGGLIVGEAKDNYFVRGDLEEMLQRIIKEGDETKLAAISGVLSVYDPGNKG